MLQDGKRSLSSRLRQSQALILLVVLLACTQLFADKVVSCNDGDTCEVRQGKKIIKVRLAGIDAPENGQDGDEQSRKFLEDLVRGKEVNLSCIDQSYGRENCSIFVGRIDVQKEMVSSGWAFDYPKYSKEKYKREQLDAKKASKGIWTFKNLTSPYCYRYTGVKECNADKLYQP